MPIIRIEMLTGRTLEQKRQLVQRITNAITESLNCPKKAVSIYISEVELENFAEAGILRVDNKKTNI